MNISFYLNRGVQMGKTGPAYAVQRIRRMNELLMIYGYYAARFCAPECVRFFSGMNVLNLLILLKLS